MNVQIKEKGFTIIEVVLVLAIAGLIFLMVFIALPALQRNQRDTQRRDDASRVVSQLQNFATNNKGSLPDDARWRGSFQNDYLKRSSGEFNDPKTGNAYVLADAAVAGDAALPDSTVQYLRGYTCSGENATSGGGNRQGAVRFKLEGSGHFCQNVQ